MSRLANAQRRGYKSFHSNLLFLVFPTGFSFLLLPVGFLLSGL